MGASISTLAVSSASRLAAFSMAGTSSSKLARTAARMGMLSTRRASGNACQAHTNAGNPAIANASSPLS